MSLLSPKFAELARVFYEQDECHLLRELDARKRDYDSECGPRYLWIKDIERPQQGIAGSHVFMSKVLTCVTPPHPPRDVTAVTGPSRWVQNTPIGCRNHLPTSRNIF